MENEDFGAYCGSVLVSLNLKPEFSYTDGVNRVTFRLKRKSRNQLVLDLEKLEYITSAGLRVLLFAQKTMATQGKMTLRNVGSEILKILKMTGMLKMMTIE